MTTTKILPNGAPAIRLSEPGQLIASLPPLLGFRPADSLVALGLVDFEGGRRVRPAVRVNLPAREHEEDMVQALTQVFRENPVAAVNLVLVGRHPSESPPTSGPPHRRLVRQLHRSFVELDQEVLHVFWVPEIRGGVPWTCYEDEECGGVLPDISSTVLAATFAAHGRVTFDSREELAGQLGPDDSEAVQRRAGLLSAAIDAMDPSVTKERLLENGLASVRSALVQAGRGDFSFSDGQVVELALALSHTGVRDACLALALDPHVRYQAERLWLELVRRTPAPERSEPAGLLTYSAYIRGEGTLASIAAAIALEANPHHTLAGLLMRGLNAGLLPERLHGLGRIASASVLRPPKSGESTS